MASFQNTDQKGAFRKSMAVWSLWSLATSLGLTCAFTIALWPVFLAPAPMEVAFLWILVGPIIAAPITGLFQLPILRSKTKSAPRWVLLTGLASIALAVGLLLVLPDLLIGVNPRFPISRVGLAVVGGGLIGAVFGLFQWWSLRRTTVAAGWWVLASALGWTLCLWMAQFLAQLPLPLPAGLSRLLAMLAGFLLVGMLTGIVFVGLFQPSHQKRRNLMVFAGLTLFLSLGLALPLRFAYSQQARILRRGAGRSHIYDVAFSPDGSLLASVETYRLGRDEHRQVVLWEVNTGKRVNILEKNESGILGSIAFLPRGDAFVTSSWSGCKTILWDLADENPGDVLDLCTRTFAVSPDGTLLAVATQKYGEGSFLIWDLAAGKPLRTIQQQVTIGCIAFSPDGRYVAAGSNHRLDRSLYVWEVATGKRVITPPNMLGPAQAVAFSPDGSRLFLALQGIQLGSPGGKTVLVWNLGSRKEEKTLQITRGISDMALAPDGGMLAVAYSILEHDPAIYLYDPSSGELLAVLKGHTAWVTSLAFSPDGRTLASGSSDGTTRLWEMNEIEK